MEFEPVEHCLHSVRKMITKMDTATGADEHLVLLTGPANFRFDIYPEAIRQDYLVEIHVETEAAPELWRALLRVGIRPAGIGARDTLRLEMGYPLHGHELGPGITSLQAGLGWVVSWDKGEFRGRRSLEAERERGVTRRLWGLKLPGRRFPRAGYPIKVVGEHPGEVTSGNFSPTLGHGIALGFLPPDVAEGTAVEVDIRGKTESATVARPPFIDR